MPLMKGFARIEAIITAAGRPLTAFCACELRSPGQFTEQGFREFKRILRGHAWQVAVYSDKSEPGRAQQCLSGDRSGPRAGAFMRFRSRCRPPPTQRRAS